MSILLRLSLIVASALLGACGEVEPPISDSGGRADRPYSAGTRAYVGNDACAACHEREASAWQGSHHDLALQQATAATVLARFPDQFGEARFLASHGGFRIQPDPSSEALPVRFTFGISPLQQYLIPGPGGSLQAFPVAWDGRPRELGGHRWFAWQAQGFPPGDPMHWSGRANRWNSQCADCHSTGVRKNYDPDTRTYATTYEVEDVGCEACHGPGSLHADDPGNVPLFSPRTRQEQVNACAPCHSRRSQLAEGFIPDAEWLDYYSPQLLTPDLYHVDGQINDEVYVYGSFLQSAMHRAGVACADCHDPHSARLERPGDETCTHCHSTDARPELARFASARGAYGTRQHHFHPPDSDAARCVSCHMPSKRYMGIDDRRDHSFRIPRPDLAVSLGVPDPCTSCHGDRTAEWAAREIAARFGPERPAHFAAVFAAADAGRPGADAPLAALASDRTEPVMVRASALLRLGQYARGHTVQAVRLARDAEPLLRLAAADATRSLAAQTRWRLIGRLLDDDLRAVRQHAVTALLPTVSASPDYRKRLEPHLRIWMEEQALNRDYPETLTALAEAHFALGELESARAHLEEALRLQANWVPGLLNLADLYRATGRDGEAEALYHRALEAAPDSPEAHYAFGLWLTRQNRLEAALPHFEEAATLAPAERQYGFAWAIALNDTGATERALSVLQTLLARWPEDEELLLTSVTVLRDQGRYSEALAMLDRLLQLHPDDPRLTGLKASLEAAAAAASGTGQS